MAIEEIVDLAVCETAEGSEVTARLIHLVDQEGRGEWWREWCVAGEWCSCAIPEATARAIRDRAMMSGTPRAA
jgi:hypothetical protein